MTTPTITYLTQLDGESAEKSTRVLLWLVFTQYSFGLFETPYTVIILIVRNYRARAQPAYEAGHPHLFLTESFLGIPPTPPPQEIFCFWVAMS